MTDTLVDLQKALEAATGAERALDARIAAAFPVSADGDETEAAAYSASIDACLELISRVLPDWAWHVGYGPRGIFPYATLHDDSSRVEALAPTVPLALLRALVKAKKYP